jgi:hypothetical protein
MKRLFRAGATVIVLFGLAHLIGHLQGQKGANMTEAEKKVVEVMQGTSFDLAGSERTMWDLFQGFSLMFSVQSITLGIVGWMATPDRRLCAAFAAASIAFALVSITYFFIVPTSFVVVAALLFAAALTRG